VKNPAFLPCKPMKFPAVVAGIFLNTLPNGLTCNDDPAAFPNLHGLFAATNRTQRQPRDTDRIIL